VQLVTMFAMVVTFPLLCLGFLLWMARLEDSLPAAVRKAERQPDPAPILAVPVLPRQAEPVEPIVATPAVPAGVDVVPVHMPAQRTDSTAGGLQAHGEAEPTAVPGVA
jgi:hypothetical protein